MGEQQAGRDVFLRREREAAGGRQRDIVDDAGDKAEAFRFEAFFERPERVLVIAGFDDQDIGGCEAETLQAVDVRCAVLGPGAARQTP